MNRWILQVDTWQQEMRVTTRRARLPISAVPQYCNAAQDTGRQYDKYDRMEDETMSLVAYAPSSGDPFGVIQFNDPVRMKRLQFAAATAGNEERDGHGGDSYALSESGQSDASRIRRVHYRCASSALPEPKPQLDFH